MRIFIGVTEIAGYYTKTADALRSQGHEVSFLNLSPNTFGYLDSAEGGLAKRVTKWCQRLAVRRGENFLSLLIWKIASLAVGPLLLPWAFLKHDFFLFGFGKSLLPWHLDVPLLRLAGKKVLFIFHGSDSRASYLEFGGVWKAPGIRRSLSDTARLTKKRKALVRRIGRYANWVVDNPFSAHFHEREVVSWYAVGMPCTKAEHIPDEPAGAIRILHAPSVPLVKGSHGIAEAVRNAAAQIPGLELVTITGRPHVEVLEVIRSCHFVVDQLYSDTPMATFAGEAASCGRPAIVCGYGWSDAWLTFSGLAEWPTYVCHEKDLEEAILKLARDKSLRESVAAAGQRLVTDWSADEVATRICRIFVGDIPKEWYFKASDLPVFYSGGGLPEDLVRETVRQLIGEFGVGVLQLKDKPRMESMAVAFAAGG
jgi:hypothetical protein